MNSMFVRLTIALSALTGRLDARRDRGATAVEYGLLVGLIAVAIIATLVLLGPALDGLFQDVLGGLEGAAEGGPAAG